MKKKQRIEDVALDIGGVLVADPWQSILLTPGTGLADRLGVPRERAAEIAEELWASYATSPADEADYWRDFSRAIGRPVDARLVRECETSIWVAADVDRLFDALAQSRRRVSIVSDNTEFWFSLQVRLCPALGSVPKDRLFLSFEHGLRKSSEPVSLFASLAFHSNPAYTLVVDDREAHVARARSHGFNAVQLRGSASMSVAPEVLSAIDRIV